MRKFLSQVPKLVTVEGFLPALAGKSRPWREKNKNAGHFCRQNDLQGPTLWIIFLTHLNRVDLGTCDLYSKKEFYWLIVIRIRKDSIGGGCKVRGASFIGMGSTHLRDKAQD